MDPARELAQLLERLGELVARAREELACGGGVVGELRLGEPQRQRERDEPLLRAVVEVALESPALLVAGRDDPRARGTKLLLLLLAQRDVDTAGDDPHDLAPLVAGAGALRHAIVRRSPRAFVNAFSYSAGGWSGAAAQKRPIIASRSGSSMKTSQK